MRTIPLSIGRIHFVGIGGIGMSGIAEILNNLGYHVQGSDVSESANVQRLRDLSISVMIGHDAKNVADAQVVVVSSAIKTDNPEVAAAQVRMVPVVRRAETTTTSMVAALIDAAGLDPTVINGGIINAYGTNARLGDGEWMVVEADESDGTFVKLPATIAIVTNLDPEHLDFYGTFDVEKEAFRTFVQNIPFYGFAALCIDHPEVQALIGRINNRRLITYGMSPQAEVRAENLRNRPGGVEFDVRIASRGEVPRVVKSLLLPMFGFHNVQNALAAIAIANEMGIDDETIARGLKSFAGVKRRFTKTGETDGVTVIDDYGHHPVEISAALQAARDVSRGKVIAVVQPHRYTRLRDLFEEFCTCFNDADVVIVSDVHEAGESSIEGIDRDALVQGLQARGHRRVLPLSSPSDLANIVHGLAAPGDLVICLGAGSITGWAHDLPAALKDLKARQAGGVA
jgi:UDP-N-acetylmuramate--alanine ligase